MVAGMVRPPDRGPPMFAGAVRGLLFAGDPSFEESSSSSSSSESESAATAFPAKGGHPMSVAALYNTGHLLPYTQGLPCGIRSFQSMFDSGYVRVRCVYPKHFTAVPIITVWLEGSERKHLRREAWRSAVLAS